MRTFLTPCLTHVRHFFASLRLVAWSFLGVRKKRDLERDFALHPLHVLVAAIFALTAFIFILGFCVRLALRAWS